MRWNLFYDFAASDWRRIMILPNLQWLQRQLRQSHRPFEGEKQKRQNNRENLWFQIHCVQALYYIQSSKDISAILNFQTLNRNDLIAFDVLSCDIFLFQNLKICNRLLIYIAQMITDDYYILQSDSFYLFHFAVLAF